MNPGSTQETRDLLAKVRRIEIKTKHLSSDFFSGGYHSAFKGRGMSFSEVRAYQYGDEVRNIDWNVTARTGDPYIKVFEEERELTIMLVIDISPSVVFGTTEVEKRSFIAELAAVIAFSAMQNNDKVGMILFSDDVQMYIPPKKGRQHVLRMIRDLLQTPAKGKETNIKKALQFLTGIMKKKSIVFLISDFITNPYEDALAVASRKHDITGFQIQDPGELQLPEAGLIRMQDAESGQSMIVDTASPEVQKAIENYFSTSVTDNKQIFTKSNADWVLLRTDQPYIPVLHRFFQQRAS